MARKHLRLFAFPILILVLAAPTGAATTNVIVGQGGATFSPGSVSIQSGDTVLWTWGGDFHSVTSGAPNASNGIFDSGIHNTGFTFSFTFTATGSYPYYCLVHGAMMTGTVTVSAPASTPSPTPSRSATPTPTPFTSRPLLFPPIATGADVPISIKEACVSILDGPCTNLWTYGGTYPGLTIRRPTGQTTNVTFFNNLDPILGGLTVHHHGNHSSATNDGYVTGSNMLIPAGGSRTYAFEGLEDGKNERGTMRFYHDHRLDETGLNVWMGLMGLFIVDDPADPTTLPSGDCDLPLVIADRQFDDDNQIQYYYDAAGVVGDKVLVNGVYQPYLDVADRKYRFRILNGANARIYILTLSTGDAFQQIGTESGLLPAPVARTAMDFGPAERLDAVVDFSGKLGQEIYLMDAYQRVPLLKFRVTHSSADPSVVPSSLRALPNIGEPTVTRNFSFDFNSSHWSINGRVFDPNRIDARPVLGSTEKWIFTNPTGTTHMVHIHDVDQQCLSRDGGPCYPWETMKETWSVGPGETLALKMKFTDHTGIYMLHCHILEHEDDGMMTQFEVIPPGPIVPLPSAPSLNMAIRGEILGGNDTLVGGFIITGNESKRVVLRAIGPSLAAAGLTGALADPILRLFDSSNQEIASSDDWRSDPLASEIQNVGLAPESSRESATALTLAPGSYTVEVSGKDGSAGIAVVEAYDISPSVNSTLANISGRGWVGTNDRALIGGFIIGGSGSAKVIARAIGPSLARFGIKGVLSDPTLTVYDGNGSPVAANDDWQDDANAAAIASYRLGPANSKEAATLLQLIPSNYTVVSHGVSDGTGTGLVEIFNIP